MLSIARPTLQQLGQQSLSLCRLPEVAHPLQGDTHPGGTVIELIAQFIDGLFQQVRFQERLAVVPGGR